MPRTWKLAFYAVLFSIGVARFAYAAPDAGVQDARDVQAEKDAEQTPRSAGYTPRKSHADGAPRSLDWAERLGKGVVRIPIEGTIDLGLAALVKRALWQHEQAGVVLLDINTLGGRVDAAIQIRDALLGTAVPTVAFVHPRAISAGALISLACDAIFVSGGASIGAATPIQLGSDGAEPVSEKMVSYFRTEMRATAEANGRRGDIAEAMVDASVEIPGLDPADKLLTLDTDGALEVGIADARASSVDEVLAALSLQGARVEVVSENWAEKLLRFLTDPVVSGLLMSLGSLGLLIELYSPGLGLPGAVGALCLCLFFGGHLIVNLVGFEELLLLAVGVGLIALEVFVVPGFGITGIAGSVCVFLALALSTVGLPLRVLFTTGAWVEPVTRVALALGVTVLGMVVALRVLPRTRFGSGLILSSSLSSNLTPRGPDAFVSVDESKRVGQRGVAESDLRPAGVARFGHERVDVVSEGGYLRAGTPVRVITVEGARIVVREEAASDGASPVA